MSRRHSLPAEVYALVDATPATVLLESAGAADSVSRLFLEPLRVIEAREPAEVQALFAAIERATAAGLYAAGFFTYECGQCFEPTAAMRSPASAEPLAWIGIYPRVYEFNHSTGEFVGGEPEKLAPPGAPGLAFETRETAAVEAEFALTESAYAERIAAIHEWIRAGDIYQLNFTAPFRVKIRGEAAALYARLRRRQPVDYGAFVHWPAGRRILSFSPELFFRVEGEGDGRCIESRPMKGTAPRGRTTREDREHAEWLRNDAKNRSENVMIVDLVRNDLGRLCEFGSVEVRDLFAVERYPAVWQMTSTVTGKLRRDVGLAEIFRALFPCGSITGAPKVRAMQLAAQVEDGPRGVYTGAIGYFSAKRTVFNVAIRTLDLDGDVGTLGVGSGVVIDSDAHEEFGECMLKARFLTATAEEWPDEFSLIESLLWREAGVYPLMDLHLDRLADSAEYFDFHCERDAVKSALLEHANGFCDRRTRKVRLLLESNGEMRISSEVLADAGGGQRIARVRIAAQRTDPRDRMLFHKTTHRRIYDEAFRAAAAAGFDDVLFLNTRGEVTEGAISNIFIERDGRFLTPPVECGLLAGIYRRHLLETLANAEERILHLEDLRRADAVYICNAVRGMRKADIDWDEVS
ncbi:MAG TPA: aminodeoxychorismate synthase component I [Terracidiphilus sp.]|nr:aminodeoxychorismate synthase component I [Terracidiphilus sp.]